MSGNTRWGAAVTFALAMGCARGGQKPLSVKVFHGEEKSFYVTSTLISGERDAVLVDAQFTLSDGRRLADSIAASGKNLKTIVITHAHPDHYFGLEAITAKFPNAEMLAAPAVVEQMKTLGPQKLAKWKPVYGADLTDAPLVPKPIAGDHLTLEGRRIDLVALEPGEVEHSTVVYIPSLKTAITGDLAYNGTHVWLAEADGPRRQAWLRNLEKIDALRPEVVIAGHAVPGSGHTVSVLDSTGQYIRDFDEAVKQSHSAAEVVATMTMAHGDLRLPIILDIAAAAAFGR